MNQIDLDLEDSAEEGGLYSPAETQDIETLLKSESVLNFNLLCSKLCFKDYKKQMTQ